MGGGKGRGVLGKEVKNKTHFWPVAFKKMQRPKNAPRQNYLQD
jgi:hypothetical protein